MSSRRLFIDGKGSKNMAILKAVSLFFVILPTYESKGIARFSTSNNKEDK